MSTGQWAGFREVDVDDQAGHRQPEVQTFERTLEGRVSCRRCGHGEHLHREGVCGYCDSEGPCPCLLSAPSVVRTFEGGATRDLDHDKPEFSGFLSVQVLRRFGAFMHANRKTAAGLRASDNWKKGIARRDYLESLFRHFADVWESQERGEVDEDALCAMLFNVQGLLHEKLLGRSVARA